MPPRAAARPVLTPVRSALVAAAFAGLYAALAGWFAAAQNVWIDESTQLLGSGLPFARMIAWLAGHPEPLGVPGDRMPPVSYLMDWTCGRTLCGGEGGFRLLHIAAATAGVALLVWGSARRYGLLAGIVAGVLMMTPQAVTAGGEIRAYPIFLAVTCLQIALFHRLVEGPRLRAGALTAFAGAGILATFTHFFGLVSTSALFAGLVVARVRSGRDLAAVSLAWAAALLLSAGILPFVGGARSVSDAVHVETGAAAIAAYLLRVPGHASQLRAPVATALFFAALAALLGIATARAVRCLPARPWREPADAVVGLLVAAAAGLTVTIAAALVVHGFDPLKPSYSIWLLPVVASIAAAALAPRAGAAAGRPWRGALAALLAAGVLLSSLPLLCHRDWFVHGPERAIAAAIGPDARATALVLAGPDWGFAYFPLVRRYGHALAQYRLDEAGRLRPIGWGGDPRPAPVSPEALASKRRIVLAEVTLRRAPDVDAPLLAPSADALALPAGRWHTTADLTRPGLYALGLTRLERTAVR